MLISGSMKTEKTVLTLTIILYFIVFLLPTSIQVRLFPVSINYILFGTYILFFSYKIKFVVTKWNYPVILLLLWSIIGLIYAPDKLNGMKQVLSFVILVLLSIRVTYLYSDSDLFTLVKILSIICILYLIESYLTLNTLRDWEGAYIGISENRHNTSFLLGFMSILNLTSFIKTQNIFLKVTTILIVVICNYFIIETTSRIGFLCQLLFLVIIFPHFIRSLSLISNIIVFGIVFSVAFYVINLDSAQDYISYSLERGATGRDGINASLMKYIDFNGGLFYLFGYGFGSLEYYSYLSELFIRDANNLVATVFIMGVIGLILFFIIFVKMILFYILNIDDISKVLCCAVFFSIFLIPSETTWFNYNYLYTIIMYILYMFLDNKKYSS